jgi:hypothetical protein
MTICIGIPRSCISPQSDAGRRGEWLPNRDEPRIPMQVDTRGSVLDNNISRGHAKVSTHLLTGYLTDANRHMMGDLTRAHGHDSSDWGEAPVSTAKRMFGNIDPSAQVIVDTELQRPGDDAGAPRFGAIHSIKPDAPGPTDTLWVAVSAATHSGGGAGTAA